jgi:hypothetical protein
MTALIFDAPPVAPYSFVRFDTDAVASTPATMMTPDGASPSIAYRAAGDGSLPRLRGPDGAAFLYIKATDAAGATNGTLLAQVFGSDLSGPPATPRNELVVIAAAGTAQTLKAQERAGVRTYDLTASAASCALTLEEAPWPNWEGAARPFPARLDVVMRVAAGQQFVFPSTCPSCAGSWPAVAPTAPQLAVVSLLSVGDFWYSNWWLS